MSEKLKLAPVSRVQVSELGNKVNLLSADFVLISNKVANKRASAQTNGMEFTVHTIQHILEVILKSGGICAYTGKPFNGMAQVTFERMDPNKGYTVENTVFVKTEANSQKSNLDAFEKGSQIPDQMKIKLMNKAIYRLQKKMKAEEEAKLERKAQQLANTK